MIITRALTFRFSANLCLSEAESHNPKTPNFQSISDCLISALRWNTYGFHYFQNVHILPPYFLKNMRVTGGGSSPCFLAGQSLHPRFRGTLGQPLLIPEFPRSLDFKPSAVLGGHMSGQGQMNVS